MKQIFDPSYSALMNNHREKFTLVAHVPSLPAASETYSNKTYFCQEDSCFYNCIVDSDTGAWMWDKVTFGPHRQFILPVTYICPKNGVYVFNDEVDALRFIITEMSKYDEYFSELLDSNPWLTDGSATVNLAVDLSNEVIRKVNRMCGSTIDIIPTPGAGETGVTPEELAVYLNKLIEVLNPHASLSNEVARLENLIAGLDAKVNTEYTFTRTTDTSPKSGKVYYTKVDNTYQPQEGLTSFVSGTTYYEVSGGTVVATPGEFRALDIKVDALIGSYDQFAAEVTVEFDRLTRLVNGATSSVGGYDSRIQSLSEKVDAVIKTYIGWDKYTSETKTSIIERLASIESQITGDGSTSGTLVSRLRDIETVLKGEGERSGLIASVGAISEDVERIKTAIGGSESGITKAIADVSSNLTKEIEARSTKDESQDATINKLLELKTIFQAISNITVSNNMSTTEVCAAIRAIKVAAASAVTTLTITNGGTTNG